MLKSGEIAGASFQHCMGVGGEVGQVKLNLYLMCGQKYQKWKFDCPKTFVHEYRFSNFIDQQECV